MLTLDTAPIFGDDAEPQPQSIELRRGEVTTNDGTGAITVERRELTHEGTLVADTVAALRAQVAAAEQWVDGQAHTFVDAFAHAWPDAELVRIDADTPTPCGTRWSLGYRLRFLLLLP